MSERLTIRHPHPYEDFITINETKQLPDTEQSRKVLNRLCDLEDKIEQGKILELPCAVGDIVYAPHWCWTTIDRTIVPYQITYITITKNKKGEWIKKYRAMEVKNGKTIDWQLNFAFDEIGKTVFLAPKEANNKLKELEKEQRKAY